MEMELVRIISSAQEREENHSDSIDGPVDIIVILSNREKYIASFYSYNAIREARLDKIKGSAEIPGYYCWAKNMVIVEDCKLEVVEKVVQHLLEEGDFWEAFEKL